MVMADGRAAPCLGREGIHVLESTAERWAILVDALSLMKVDAPFDSRGRPRPSIDYGPSASRAPRHDHEHRAPPVLEMPDGDAHFYILVSFLWEASTARQRPHAISEAGAVPVRDGAWPWDGKGHQQTSTNDKKRRDKLTNQPKSEQQRLTSNSCTLNGWKAMK